MDDLKSRRDMFLEKISTDPVTGCWNWTGATTRKKGEGYGRIRTRDGLKLSHRVSYEIHEGPIPEGKLVLHHCDNGLCNNPAHLYIGDYSDNMRDRERRGRSNASKLSREFSAKLSDDEVRAIRDDSRYASEIAKAYGITRWAVWNVQSGRTWRHIDPEVAAAARSEDRSVKGSRHGKARLTEDDIRAIRLDTRTRKVIAKDYGVGPSQITRIKLRERWSHVK